ncbi:hypothetical protein [Streptomyces sp. 184]|uniref:hypothetical protein n=1 Tax=Streptomyces sp. 184 TaxID=1827526 RepID=UPI0038924AD0
MEIGDGFRLPELPFATGARLHEVGTTNRTIADYGRALGLETGFILKTHPSNFRIEGFTGTVPVRDLAGLGAVVVGDIGSGLSTPDPVLRDEPDASAWLAQGSTLVIASGDKLLGGPRAGLLLGSRAVLHTLRRHPPARSARVDKLTLAALEATLMAPTTPARTAVHADADSLHTRAVVLVGQSGRRGVEEAVVASAGCGGGRGAPWVELPGWATRLPLAPAAPLRRGSPCAVGRIPHGHCLPALRCIPPERDTGLLGAVLAANAA